MIATQTNIHTFVVSYSSTAELNGQSSKHILQSRNGLNFQSVDGGIGAIAALAVLALPETQGVQVPETVQAAATTSSSSTRAAGAIGSAFEEGGGVELDQSDDTTEGQRNDAGSLLGRGHVASDSKI